MLGEADFFFRNIKFFGKISHFLIKPGLINIVEFVQGAAVFFFDGFQADVFVRRHLRKMVFNIVNIAFQFVVEIITFGFSETFKFFKGFFHQAAQENPFVFIQFIWAVRDGVGHSYGHFQVFEIGSVGCDFLQVLHIGFYQLVIDVHITGIVQCFKIDVAVYFTTQDAVVQDFPQFKFFFFVPQGHFYTQVERFAVKRFNIDRNFFSFENAFASSEASHG